MDTHYSERLSARESNKPSGSLLGRGGNSMAKVVRFHELGGPEVLRLEEITFEDPAPGELRLKVGAIGLNRREVVYRSGGFGAPNKYPAALSGQSPQHNASVTSVV
jgi:hypothetical protein